MFVQKIALKQKKNNDFFLFVAEHYLIFHKLITSAPYDKSACDFGNFERNSLNFQDVIGKSSRF